ncbi:MAG TPA: glycosyltransferase family 39 protein [Mycobacteriales bacterium]|jgi:mannosyltransferase|nr:glycosyltransferase family 39 protein [Mycobacteriales bacterium]
MPLDAEPTRTTAAWDVLIPAQAPAATWTAGEPSLSFASKRESRVARVLVLLIAPVVLAGLGSWGLDRHGAYGGDESATRWAALLPIHSLFQLLRHIDAVHGFYYLAMHAWVVFGKGPIALRLPSLIAAILTAGIVTELGRRLSGRLCVGVVAGLLYAISPFVMFYAQTARSYAIVSLLVGSATLALLRALEASRADRPRLVVIRRWVGYGLLVALAGWLNEVALLMVAAHAVTMVFTGYARRVRLQWLASATLGVAAVIPLFAISSGQQTAVDWVTRPTAGDVGSLIRDYFGPHPVVMIVTIGCALVACLPRAHVRSAIADGRARAAWRSRGPVSVVSVALPLLVVPPLILITESILAQPLYVDRYLLYCVLGAVLLVAEGATRLGSRMIGANARSLLWLPGVGVAIFMFVVQIPAAQYIRTPDSRLRDFGAPANYLEHHARPGDGVLFFSDYFRLMELGYPSDFRNLSDIGAAKSPLQSGTFKGVDAPLLSAAPRILSRDRVWVVGHAPFGALPTTLDDQERDLLVDNYRMVKILPFHGLTVTLWVHHPERLLPPPEFFHDRTP